MVKTLIELLKTALVGGLLVLMPVLLLYLVLCEAIDLVIALGTPLADLFPAGTFGEIRYPGLLALLLIFGASLAIGLAMRSSLGRRVGHGIERAVLGRLPLYRVLKLLTRGFARVEIGESIRPAVLTSQDGTRELVYVVEDPGGDQLTILRPHAPAGFTGPVAIVDRDRITMVNRTLGDASRVFGQWGVGAQELLAGETESPDG